MDNNHIDSLKELGKKEEGISISSSPFLGSGYQVLHLLSSSLQGVKCRGLQEEAELRHTFILIGQRSAALNSTEL